MIDKAVRLGGAPLDRHSLAVHALDFAAAAALIVIAFLHLAGLFMSVSLEAVTGLCIILSMMVNLLGLFVAVAYQRSVFVITFFFTLIFFSFATCQQLAAHFDSVMDDPWILQRASFFCLVFSIFCLAALLLIGSARAIGEQAASEQAAASAFPVRSCVLLIGAIAFSITIGLIWYSKDLFTDRTTYFDLIQAIYPQPANLLYTGALRPFIIYGSVVGIWISYSHQRLAWCMAFALTLLSGFVLANPLITPRFEFGTMLYAIIFYFLGRSHCRLLVLALFLGVAASPIFNLFRLSDSQVEVTGLTSFLVSMDFDAFSLICHTIWHVDYHGLSYGENILNAVLFFVPRNLWPGKLEITPYYLMDSLSAYRGLWNYNLSEPLIAEGYFAFGFIGIILITLAYLRFAWFLELNAGNDRLRVTYLFCSAAPPLLFILLRGSLMVGISVIVGHLIAMTVALTLVKIRFSNAGGRRSLAFRDMRQGRSRLLPRR